jgi:O-6-methylguanine DNA methyltransferase
MINISFKTTICNLAKQIPTGKVATYGQLAKMAGSPGAARAVGMIMSKNLSPEVMPCHRVVASNGNLTGYAFGGINSKKRILLSEGVSFIGERVNLQISQWNQNN